MRQRCKEIISKLLAICLVMTLMPVMPVKAEESGGITIITQPGPDITADCEQENPDYGTLSVDATVASGSAISYQWVYVLQGDGYTVTVRPSEAVNSSLSIPEDLGGDILYPGEYEFYCELTAPGCTMVETDHVKVIINKLVYGSLSETVMVKSGKAVEDNEYVLPKLPGGMYYAYTASANNTLVSGTPTVTYKWNSAASEGAYYLTFDTVAKEAGTSDTITVVINGGDYYENAVLTLEVEAVDKIPLTITGVTKVDGTYNGYSQKGYEGQPSAPGYSGEFDYHYTGRTYSGTDYDSTEPPADAGDYTLIVSAADTDYSGIETVDFSIEKKEVYVYATEFYINRYESLPVLSKENAYYQGFVGTDIADECLSAWAVPKFSVSDASQPGQSSIDFLTEAVLNGEKGANYTLNHVGGALYISEYSNECDVLQVNLDGAVIDLDNSNITATVPSSVTSHTFDFTVSEGATWNLYSDYLCTGEIADNTAKLETGNNTVYLMVTSDSGYVTCVYTVTITRKSGESNTGGGSSGGSSGGGSGNSSGGSSSSGSKNNSNTGESNSSKYQVRGSSDKNWNKVEEELQSGTSGSIDVTMKGTTVLPASVLKELYGKDITLNLTLGNGVSWVLKGIDITEAETKNQEEWKDIDMQAELGASKIPDEVLKNFLKQAGMENTAALRQLSLSHDGSFGFRAKLFVNVGKDMAGKMANLFYYNTNTKEMEYVYAGVVDTEGNVGLDFWHASDYAIVLDQGELAAAELKKAILAPEKSIIYTGGDTDKTAALTVTLPEALSNLTESDSLYPIITYTSSDSKVAVVDEKGIVTAKALGTTTITANITSGSATYSLNTEITVKKAYINLVKEKTNYKLGEGYTYKATGYGVSTDKIIFSTSKKSILVIGKKSGKATAKSKGTDYVIVEYGSVRKVLKVTVK